jgi:hypothetical protein
MLFVSARLCTMAKSRMKPHAAHAALRILSIVKISGFIYSPQKS